MNESTRRTMFDRDGYLQVEDLLHPRELAWYLDIYDKFLKGEINAGSRKSDLGAWAAPARKGVENITQIMCPSELVTELRSSAAYTRALEVAREILGHDMAFDFDMFINKAPQTNTPTPWHQDAAYWLDLPDKRAASCWIALDEATKENGCMWFVPSSQKKPLRPHRPAGKGGGALECDCTEAEGVCVPLRPGSCTFHDGGTLHYSRGNSTAGQRCALIVNFRSGAMVELERAKGFDHKKSADVRVNRNVQARG